MALNYIREPGLLIGTSVKVRHGKNRSSERDQVVCAKCLELKWKAGRPRSCHEARPRLISLYHLWPSLPPITLHAVEPG